MDTKDFIAKAAITYSDAIYKKSVTGIKPVKNDVILSLRNMLGLLNSDLYSYIAINTFASIGIEREQAEGYEKFNIPYLDRGITQHVESIEEMKKKYMKKK